MSIRLNTTVNDKKYIFFSRTTEEVVQVKLFFNYFKQGFKEIRIIGRNVLRKEQEILSFNWPNDTLFDKWVTNYGLALTQLLKETIEGENVDNSIAIEKVQLIDVSVQTLQRLDEEQSIATMDVAIQTDDMVGDQSIVINIQITKLDTSSISEVVPQLEEQQM